MADTIVSDAAVFPQDEGLPGIVDGEETWDSAGLLMMLAQASGRESYARSTTELDFSGHDATNDTVDVQPGVAYLDFSGETITVQSSKGGSIPPSYDTTLPSLPAICVVVPTVVTTQLQASTLSQVWLAYATDTTISGISPGDVYVRSDDTGSVGAPPHPSVELGSANPDNSSGDVLRNRGGIVPSGIITMWSGTTSDVPSGWTLCDGTGGTPDLRDRFITGAGGQYATGDTGGSDSVALSESELPSHNHGYQQSQITYENINLQSGGNDDVHGSTTAASTSNAGGNDAHENRPPYHALAYIMKL